MTAILRVDAVGDAALIRRMVTGEESARFIEVVLATSRGPVFRLRGVDDDPDEMPHAGVRWLADPPRLAALSRRGVAGRVVTEVALIDVGTGTVDWQLPDLLEIGGWSPDGSALFAFEERALVLAYEDGRRRRLGGYESHGLMRAWFEAGSVEDARMAVAQFHGTWPRVRGFDLLRGDPLFTLSVGDHESVFVSRDLSIVARKNPYRVAFYDVSTLGAQGGEARATIQAAPDRRIERAWCDDDCNAVVLALENRDRSAPSFALHRRDGDGFALIHELPLEGLLPEVSRLRDASFAVDAAGARVLTLHEGRGVSLASLDGRAPSTRIEGAVDAACFTGAYAACVIDRAVHVIDGGGARLVEGPGDVVALAPHARGVVAVSDALRADVVELD